MFMIALQSMNKLSEPLFGDLKPDNSVDLYFNLSSDGTANERGPWNEAPNFRYVADPLAEIEQRSSGSSTPPMGPPRGNR